MATSLDPLQIINAGAEPWVDAAKWTGAFLGMVLVGAVTLWFWHRERLRLVAILLLAAQISFVAWTYAHLYAEYF